RHHTADDTPYGGGGGMIMKAEPIVAAIEANLPAERNFPVILMSPQGRVFTQPIAQELARNERIALVCGHYERMHERARELGLNGEICIGDYVMSGGELRAMVIVDAVARLQRGVLGYPDALAKDSHATGILEHPHYTRPPEFRGMRVPDVLLSGH